jgi:hypothetical protein
MPVHTLSAERQQLDRRTLGGAMADADNGHDHLGREGERDSRAKLGEEVAAQMDAIEADFGDEYEIGNVVTIVEVIRPEGAAIRVRCSQQPWVGIGMLRVAEKALEAQGGAP